MDADQIARDIIIDHVDDVLTPNERGAVCQAVAAAIRAAEERGRDSIRCPACGTLEACGCASPGWPFYGKDVKAQGLVLNGNRQVAAPNGHVLDDAGNVIAGEWKTWASIVEDVRTTHTAFIPTDQTAAAARTPEAPDAR